MPIDKLLYWDSDVFISRIQKTVVGQIQLKRFGMQSGMLYDHVQVRFSM